MPEMVAPLTDQVYQGGLVLTEELWDQTMERLLQTEWPSSPVYRIAMAPPHLMELERLRRLAV